MTRMEVLSHAALSRETLLAVRQSLERSLEGEPGGEATSPVALGPEVLRLLLKVLSPLSEGHDLALIPLETHLTPQDAATLLGVSRPHVLELIRTGALSGRRVGSHHRLPLETVLAFARRREAGRTALAELTGEAQDWGMY